MEFILIKSKLYTVAVVTSTRADFGLLSKLIAQLEQSEQLNCQLYVTGSHLLASQGMTVEEVKSKYSIFAEVEILDENNSSDNDLTIALASSKALAEFAKKFAKNRPDILVVLGDRYELLGICSAALLSHIPIAHIHGGELTEGAMDEAIRHAVTKLSNLHFVAAEPYRERVIQMGEQPSQVHTVGSPGLDLIESMQFLSKEKLEESLGFKLIGNIILVTYHPVSWGSSMGKLVLKKLFKALEKQQNSTIIWTASNTDATGKALNLAIEQWVKKIQQSSLNINAHFMYSLGSLRYLSLMKLAKVVLGNSSSGIIEAPMLKVATVNIGDRQAGRLRANSILDCGETQVEIEQALATAMSNHFQNKLTTTKSLYGTGQSAQKMVTLITQFCEKNEAKNITKTFYDLDRK